MSGIFGFINLDGRPANPQRFQRMSDEMARWGPDCVGSILSGNVAFGHALLVVTHESRFEQMPVHDQGEGIIFSAAARLDNRDELCDIFGVSHQERPVTSDGQLVRRAYRRWGTDSCKHIFGDWSFAAWHIQEQKLFLARDHLGNTGLYYYCIPPLVVFASSTEAILSHPDMIRILDEMQIAKYLGLDVRDEGSSRTFWKNICSLSSAHSITIASSRTNLENYWRLDDAPSVRLSSDSAYLEGFIDHFRRAVHVRLNSVRSISTSLSAGLDSGAVTALAAEALIKDNRFLTAFTSVPLYPLENIMSGVLGDEWPLAHELAAFYDNIEHIPIRAEDITPLAAIDYHIRIVNTPASAPANMFWILSMLENAQERNNGVMLTGQLGNGGVSWSGGINYVFYLFVQNQWQKGLQALTEWKSYHQRSWLGALKHHILRPLINPVWSQWKQFGYFSTRKNEPFSFFREDFIKRMAPRENERLFIDKPIDPLTQRMLVTIRNGIIAGPLWHAFGCFFNMEVRDPTADIRLLEFCMGVPDEQNTFKGGERMLIRRATAGILPDSIRWNTQRGRQSADIFQRLADHRDEMARELDRFESTPDVTRYLDVQRMKDLWFKLLKPSPDLTAGMVYKLLRSINMGCFLLSFSKK